MGTWGTLEKKIESAALFVSEASSPVTPGAPPVETGVGRREVGLEPDGALDELIASNVAATLETAQALAQAVPSSTTFAAWAVALEGTGNTVGAGDRASEALGRCVDQLAEFDGELIDPLSAQLALEVLFRVDRADDAVAYASQLPLGPQQSLVMAANLAVLGRLDEARTFAESVDGPGRHSILGYVLVLAHDYHGAISHLRAALRGAPDDADSAMNLSIALWRLGSHRKALSAALQATRAGSARMDAVLHYLELLLEEKEFLRVDREVGRQFDMGAAPTSRLLVMQARAKLALDDQDDATRLLERAATAAREAQDDDALAEIRSNLVRIRAVRGKIGRDDALRQLAALHANHKTSDVVVVNMAQVANRKHHVMALRRAFDEIAEHASPGRRAFIEYQIANLLGDNEAAGAKAAEWVELEPNNTYAISAAMVSIGTGLERWDDATRLAERVLVDFPDDSVLINNVGYIFAMTGRGDEAIRVLERFVEGYFVAQATLGLAYLSKGEIETGMSLYRQAAIAAERAGDDDDSLMTAYQALVVRRLGLLTTHDPMKVRALALPAVPMPDDWADRSEYLRLQALAKKHKYLWPLTL